MKKFFGMILALVIVLSVCGYVFAAPEDTATSDTNEQGVEGIVVDVPSDDASEAASDDDDEGAGAVDDTSSGKGNQTTITTNEIAAESYVTVETFAKTDKAAAIAKDLQDSLASVGLETIVQIVAVSKKAEVNVNIVLLDLKKEEQEKTGKINDTVVAKADVAGLKADFGFLTDTEKGCEEIEKVNIAYYTCEVLQEDGSLDYNDKESGIIGSPIVLEY